MGQGWCHWERISKLSKLQSHPYYKLREQVKRQLMAGQPKEVWLAFHDRPPQILEPAHWKSRPGWLTYNGNPAQLDRPDEHWWPTTAQMTLSSASLESGFPSCPPDRGGGRSCQLGEQIASAKREQENFAH